MLFKSIFFEQIQYKGCNEKQHAFGRGELTKAEIDHKNIRRYQQVSLYHLETYKDPKESNR